MHKRIRSACAATLSPLTPASVVGLAMDDGNGSRERITHLGRGSTGTEIDWP